MEQSIASYTSAITTIVAVSVTFSVMTSVASSAMGGFDNPMPMIFGVQRFAASSGLAVNQSELHAGIADALASGPINGHLFDLNGAESDEDFVASEGRRLTQAKRRRSPQRNAFDSALANMGIVVGFILPIHVLLLLLWKYAINRGYYRQLRRDQSLAAAKQHATAPRKLPRFRKLPSFLLFPIPEVRESRQIRIRPLRGLHLTALVLVSRMLPVRVQTIALNYYAIVLMTTSVRLLTDSSTDCDAQCRASTCIVLAGVCLHILLAAVVLAHFSIRHRRASWNALDLPDNPGHVEDPLYRLISRARSRMCGSLCARTAIERSTGEFERDEADTLEPQRTERLLRRVTLTRSSPSDALDSLGVTWLADSSGSSCRGVFYRWTAVTVSLLIAGICAMGKALETGSQEAVIQLSVILSLQWGFALWCYILQPAGDRLENLEAGTQFTLEGVMTLVLIRGHCDLALYFGVVALFLPLAVQTYDASAVVSSLIRQCTSKTDGEFSAVSCTAALCALLVSVPSLIAEFLGIQVDSTVDVLRDAMDVAEDCADRDMGHVEVESVPPQSVALSMDSAQTSADDAGVRNKVTDAEDSMRSGMLWLQRAEQSILYGPDDLDQSKNAWLVNSRWDPKQKAWVACNLRV